MSGIGNNDELLFFAEEAQEDKHSNHEDSWKIMVVDDFYPIFKQAKESKVQTLLFFMFICFFTHLALICL